jgi:hypothetical protein
MRQHQIEGGPTRAVLLKSFAARTPVTFRAANQSVLVTINQIAHEDGSGDSFSFAGFVAKGNELVRGWVRYNPGQPSKGWIEGIAALEPALQVLAPLREDYPE